jgi:hypothetical protein
MNKIFALAVSLVLVSGFTTAQAAPLTLEDVNVIKQVVMVRMSPAFTSPTSREIRCLS